jgi:hypothetical protein
MSNNNTAAALDALNGARANNSNAVRVIREKKTGEDN